MELNSQKKVKSWSTDKSEQKSIKKSVRFDKTVEVYAINEHDQIKVKRAILHSEDDQAKRHLKYRNA